MTVEFNFRAVTSLTPASSTPGPGTGSQAPAAWIFPNNAISKTADYTLTQSDGTVRFDASTRALVGTLPDAAACYNNGNGQVFCIKKEDASENPINVKTATSSQMIDGFSSMVIALQYDSLTVQSNGTGWDIISTN